MTGLVRLKIIKYLYIRFITHWMSIESQGARILKQILFFNIFGSVGTIKKTAVFCGHRNYLPKYSVYLNNSYVYTCSHFNVLVRYQGFFLYF